MKIRCKFRVLSITSAWNDSTLVSLRPCTAKDKFIDESGNMCSRLNPENAAFWKATPSGEATLTYEKGDALPEWVKTGAYVFVDLDTEVSGGWNIGIRLFPWGGGIEVEATTHKGSVKFNVSGEHAAPVIDAILREFLPLHARSLKTLEEVKWSVAFVPTAEPAVIEGWAD